MRDPNRDAFSAQTVAELWRLRQRFRQTLHLLTYLRNGFELVFAVDFSEIYAYLNPGSPGSAFSTIFPNYSKDTKVSTRHRLALTFLVNNPYRSALMLYPHVRELHWYVRDQTTRRAELIGVAQGAWKKLSDHQRNLLERLRLGDNLSQSDITDLMALLKDDFASICADATDYFHLSRFGDALAKLGQLLSDRRILFYGTGGESDVFRDTEVPSENELQERLYKALYIPRRYSRPAFLDRRYSRLAFNDSQALSLVKGLNERLHHQRVVFVTRSQSIESVLSRQFPELFQHFCSLETFFFLALWNEGEDAWWFDKFDAEISAAVAAIESIELGNSATSKTKIRQSLESIDNSMSSLINQRLGNITAKHKWLVNEMRDSDQLDPATTADLSDERLRPLLGFVRFVSQDEQFRQKLRQDSLITWDHVGSAVDRLRKIGRWQSAYSCFISYSSTDDGFLKKLVHDLREAGVECWFAPENLKAGADFSQEIEDAIHTHDRLLVVLSEHSLDSYWVRREVEAGLEIESRRDKDVVIPVKLDDALEQTERPWATHLRRTRHAADFTGWENEEAYDVAFQRLLDDLHPSTE